MTTRLQKTITAPTSARTVAMIDLEAAGDTVTIHLHIVGVSEGTAAAWLLISSLDGLDSPALDGFVQILLARFDAT
jgi:hypothetical protein